MKKIIVIGCPGSGKSRLSRALHNKTGIPLYHLDMMYWNADKTTVEKRIFLERLNDAIEKDAWIIDGNYGSTMELRMAACDTVIFLDYPLDVCFDGIKERRGKPRCDMPWIETEEDAEFIEFIKRYNEQQKPKVLALLDKYREKNLIIFKCREEADKFVRNMSVRSGTKMDKQELYELLRTIPRGKVITYGALAEMLGDRAWARAVGNALHSNPDGEKYPCYKVVNSKGELSSAYAFGGADEQKRRLEQDGIIVENGKVDLKKYGYRSRI